MEVTRQAHAASLTVQLSACRSVCCTAFAMEMCPGERSPVSTGVVVMKDCGVSMVTVISSVSRGGLSQLQRRRLPSAFLCNGCREACQAPLSAVSVSVSVSVVRRQPLRPHPVPLSATPTEPCLLPADFMLGSCSPRTAQLRPGQAPCRATQLSPPLAGTAPCSHCRHATPHLTTAQGERDLFTQPPPRCRCLDGPGRTHPHLPAPGTCPAPSGCQVPVCVAGSDPAQTPPGGRRRDAR